MALHSDELEALLPLVYDRLKQVASRIAPDGTTVSPTALVHDAWLKVGSHAWQDEQHFVAAASRAMRQIIADRARHLRSQKRGGEGLRRTTLSGLGDGEPPVDLLDLHDALTTLEQEDPQAARIVELRYLGGLSITETAEMLGLSRTAVHRSWRLSRAWLKVRLQG